jgi:hypothetical protein
MRYRVKNWDKYQHYKDRTPPWIKLHVSILNNRAFTNLDLESQGLLMQLWVLASEKNGEIDDDPEELAYRLRKKSVNPETIDGLVKSGFLLADASGCSPEERRVETETEAEAETEREEEKEKPVSLAREALPVDNSKAEPYNPRHVEPTPEQVKTEASLRGFPQIDAEAFISHYAATGWEIRQGVYVRDWRQLIPKWREKQKTIDARGREKNTGPPKPKVPKPIKCQRQRENITETACQEDQQRGYRSCLGCANLKEENAKWIRQAS